MKIINVNMIYSVNYSHAYDMGLMKLYLSIYIIYISVVVCYRSYFDPPISHSKSDEKMYRRKRFLVAIVHVCISYEYIEHYVKLLYFMYLVEYLWLFLFSY